MISLIITFLLIIYQWFRYIIRESNGGLHIIKVQRGIIM